MRCILNCGSLLPVMSGPLGLEIGRRRVHDRNAPRILPARYGCLSALAGSLGFETPSDSAAMRV